MSVSNIYSADFYEVMVTDKYTQINAQLIIEEVLKYISPKSIIDVGCGVGQYIKILEKYGIKGIGFDGPWVLKEKILIDRFNKIDLVKESLPKIKADLVLCLEVAEHLPKIRAESFIVELTAMSSIVLFSAAIPNQGGVNHINEQWQSYWVSLFEKNNYAAIDCLRPSLWNNKNVATWYKQNMFFFVDKAKLNQFKKLKQFKNNTPVNIVHPDLFNKEKNIQFVIKTFTEIPEIVRNAIKHRKERRMN